MEKVNKNPKRIERTGVIVISQQALLRMAIISVLKAQDEYEIIGEYECYPEINSITQRSEPCCVILDADMSVSQIENLVKLFKKSGNKVIILGSIYDKNRLVELMPLEADGYLTTDLGENEILELLAKVRQDGQAFSSSLIPELVCRLNSKLTSYNESEKVNMLTNREKEVLKLLACGYTNGQIAQKLVISVYTVKNHVHSILDKMAIDNRAQLVSYVLTKGLVNQ